ncbi:MAG TPA: T6SS amidase immunity protein Tai4 family protein [Cellvibrionaceae bacterium]|nr:T6SS amidase immunity protein Tai4 family protein [Cellvibrionaceae bacterium]HMW73528.1 T6SS amidase immunity protein Tai4 family protein [Cellvibrionaceae bacterium]HMY38014.1 T6SS amidase immunity protein Tai4 family protein [Marinagarivorans sp.]HNG60845.1 T6SS amidase immunity protein Tai4 family protein [Cellvibrionaceae bacterium]
MATKIKAVLYIFVAAGFLATLSCSHIKTSADSKINKNKKALKNWTLSYCLASALEPGPAKQDALNTAGAYLEAGNQPIEAYEAATLLINNYLAKNYTGIRPGSFNTKKCIDLYESSELDSLTRKYSN